MSGGDMHPLMIATENDSLAVFKSYEEEYLKCSRAINRHINELGANNPTADQVHQIDAMAQADLQEADNYIRSMMVEARSLEGQQRSKCKTKVEQYKSDLVNLRANYELAQHRVRRQELIGSEGNIQGIHDDQKTRLLQSSATLEKSSEALESSRRILAETEDIGVNILGDLEEQRETLISAHAKVKQTSSIVHRARYLLNKMGRQALTQRICLYVCIILLVFVIIFLVYFLYIRKATKK
eukprot:CAMPEP_0117858872 /NCGR_PEP_ID=MMETSP0950-20121206/2781_1 /TAXON_ID=44440 /ORGANISM="Chattonella subsalsa, Strain CCMP2191" /LENGTH=239 /DNA_ID=CAMNT_0005708607 /DNA_START=85 /DNA_END=804 /DNA_ORIENTATION=+